MLIGGELMNVVLLWTRAASGLTSDCEGLDSSIGVLLGLRLRGELVGLALLCLRGVS